MEGKKITTNQITIRFLCTAPRKGSAEVVAGCGVLRQENSNELFQ